MTPQDHPHSTGPFTVEVLPPFGDQTTTRRAVLDAFGNRVCDVYARNSVGNAALLAAAPELLEALEELISYQSVNQLRQYDNFPVFAKVDAALAKANNVTVRG